MKRCPHVSLILPVYNGDAFIRESIQICTDVMRDNEIDCEIIVVSDGSTDDTLRIARNASAPNVRVVGYSENQGKGYAVTRGMAAAKGAYIGFLDSDLDISPLSFVFMVRTIEGTACDAVIGSKRHPESQVVYPMQRRIYSWCYQNLVRVLLGLNVSDTQVGAKIFSRELVVSVLPYLTVKQFAFDLELLAAARKQGYVDIREAPVTLDYAFSGSRIDLRSITQALVDTLAIFYRDRILRQYPKKP